MKINKLVIQIVAELVLLTFYNKFIQNKKNLKPKEKIPQPLDTKAKTGRNT